MRKNSLKERAFKSLDWDRIRGQRDDEVRQFKEETRTNFRHTYPKIRGPMFTDEGTRYLSPTINLSTLIFICR
jgi:hypothetical protein